MSQKAIKITLFSVDHFIATKICFLSPTNVLFVCRCHSHWRRNLHLLPSTIHDTHHLHNWNIIRAHSCVCVPSVCVSISIRRKFIWMVPHFAQHSLWTHESCRCNVWILINRIDCIPMICSLIFLTLKFIFYFSQFKIDKLESFSTRQWWWHSEFGVLFIAQIQFATIFVWIENDWLRIAWTNACAPIRIWWVRYCVALFF